MMRYTSWTVWLIFLVSSSLTLLAQIPGQSESLFPDEQDELWFETGPGYPDHGPVCRPLQGRGAWMGVGDTCQDFRFGESFNSIPVMPWDWRLAWFQGWQQDTDPSGTDLFTETWSAFEPQVPTAGTGLQDSQILREGMHQDSVIQLLGSPLTRFRIGEAEVWRYSPYTLYFEDNRLVAIR